MANHRKPEGEKVYPVCGTVVRSVKMKVLRYAKQERLTLAKAVGRIVKQWADDMPEVTEKDERQMGLIHNHTTGVKCNKDCPMWNG